MQGERQAARRADGGIGERSASRRSPRQPTARLIDAAVPLRPQSSASAPIVPPAAAGQPARGRRGQQRQRAGDGARGECRQRRRTIGGDSVARSPGADRNSSRSSDFGRGRRKKSGAAEADWLVIRVPLAASRPASSNGLPVWPTPSHRPARCRARYRRRAGSAQFPAGPIQVRSATPPNVEDGERLLQFFSKGRIVQRDSGAPSPPTAISVEPKSSTTLMPMAAAAARRRRSAAFAAAPAVPNSCP